MLVLLIIFLITVPVVTTSIPVNAAEGAQRGPRDQAGEHRDLGRRQRAASSGTICEIPTTNALIDRLKKIAVLTPQPEVQIRGDGGAKYDSVGRIIYAAQRAGIAKVGFITEPPVRGG